MTSLFVPELVTQRAPCLAFARIALVGLQCRHCANTAVIRLLVKLVVQINPFVS